MCYLIMIKGFSLVYFNLIFFNFNFALHKCIIRNMNVSPFQFSPVPPDKAENLICTAHTMSSFYCQWNDATLDTNLWNTDELLYKADCR